MTQYLNTLASPHSRKMMRHGLKICLDLYFGPRHKAVEAFEWWLASYEHTNTIRARLTEKYSPAAANLYLASLRGVLRQCLLLQLMDYETYGRVGSREALPRIKGDSPQVGRWVREGEKVALYDVCERDTSPAGIRDAAILAIMFDTGLRRFEVSALDVDDIDLELNVVVVRAGKGRKLREVPLTKNTRARYAVWVRFTGAEHGPLFYRIRKGGMVERVRLSDRPIETMMTKRATQAGIKAVSPHDTRRTFASDCFEAGIPGPTVQALMGHSDFKTTAKYDRRGEGAKVDAIRKLEAWRKQESHGT